MNCTHYFNEITTFADTERRYRCARCGAETTRPFPNVNPYTGEVESTRADGFTREDVKLLRMAAIALETDEMLNAVDNAKYVQACRANADRISSLLPPE